MKAGWEESLQIKAFIELAAFKLISLAIFICKRRNFKGLLLKSKKTYTYYITFI